MESPLPDFLNALRKQVSGELRTDLYSRMFYSTDASIYQVMPHGVLIPRSPADVQAAVELAAEYRVPILPRGGGSSLAGQAVNTALVIDLTRHLDQVLEVNVEERWVRVQPGLVLDELNLQLAPHDLQFGPDPASSNRATVGGIVGNNSTGSHSIVYGMTADHVLAAEVLLSDGSQARFENLNDEQLAHRLAASGLEGEIYRAVKGIAGHGETAIRSGTPRHWRRCGGYNLDRLIPSLPAGENGLNGGPSYLLPRPAGFNLAPLICGAEGTLAVMSEIQIGLVPRPKMTALGIVHFPSLQAALQAVPQILEVNPSAVELLDNIGLTRCREVPAYARLLSTFIEGDPNCVLITEFYGETTAELQAAVQKLKDLGVGTNVVPIYTAEGQTNVWTVRKVGLGFLMSVKGDFKPVPFIEDAAVPVEHLADYIHQVESFCSDIGTKVGYYAHASAGCLHVRPLINTKTASEIAKLPAILEFSVSLLGEYGGALSSEHGDGRARSWINERFFGKDLYALYRETKRAFDPNNILNPGNVVEAPAMTTDLRFGGEYTVLPLQEHLDFSEDMGFHRAVEMCNGAGICRKRTTGTMCPSFMVTREEEHSTRGRANALRAAMSGLLPPGELTGKRLFEVMDLCIECKACKAECPSSVDMAKIKFEYLAQYYAANPVPLRTRLFADIARLSRLASGPLAPLANWGMDLKPVKWSLERFLAIGKERSLPKFARQPFTQWFENRGKVDGRKQGAVSRRSDTTAATPVKGSSSSTPGSQSLAPGSKGPVVLFNDTFNTYNHPETAIAATIVLEAAGFEVLLPGHRCCGRPMISKGLVEPARQAARETVEKLHPYAERGIPIIGLEPSCLLTLRDEYAYLLPGDARVGQIAEHSLLFEEFIADLDARGELDLEFTPLPDEILLHGHCHQKALVGTGPSIRTLSLAGAPVREVDSGCCGMAGSFGYEAEHVEISRQMGERRLLPAVRSHKGIIVAAGVSCRAQIEDGTGVRALHPAELLYGALVKTEEHQADPV